MKALIKLHLKENLRKNTFILFGVLGGLISILVITSATFSVNAVGGDSNYAQFGFQWVFLTIISSLASVSLSMGVVSKHRHGISRNILKLHGLNISNQYFSLILGNVILSTIMALILTVGMIVNIITKSPNISLLGFFSSFSIYLLAPITMGLITSLLSLLLPTSLSALFGVFITFLGAVRGILLLIVGNYGGLFGKVTTFLINLVPPIDSFGELARDLFFSEVSNLSILFKSLIYIWLLIGLCYFVVKGVGKYEK